MAWLQRACEISQTDFVSDAHQNGYGGDGDDGDDDGDGDDDVSDGDGAPNRVQGGPTPVTHTKAVRSAGGSAASKLGRKMIVSAHHVRKAG